MISAVSGVAGSVRVEQLTRAGITRAQKHGKRQDATGQARVVRQVEALTRTGLEVGEQFEAHVAHAFIPKAKAKAMHLLIQFPQDLVDPSDAEGMLDHARAFCERVFGPDAIFADRIDLDERNTQVVDVFVAPKYLKVTKRESKIAVSMTKHLKELAKKHGEPPLPYGMGRALQTELYHYFRDVMKLGGVQRGVEKVFAGPDWKSAEEQRLEELQGKKAEFSELVNKAGNTLDAVRQRENEVERLEQRVAAERAALGEERARLAQDAAKLQADVDRVQLSQEALAAERKSFADERERLAVETADHAKSVEHLADRIEDLDQKTSRLEVDRAQLEERQKQAEAERAGIAQERENLRQIASNIAAQQTRADEREFRVAQRERSAEAFEFGVGALCRGELGFHEETQKLAYTGAPTKKEHLVSTIRPAFDRLWELARMQADKVKREVDAKVAKELAIWAKVKLAYEAATAEAKAAAQRFQSALQSLDSAARRAALADNEVQAASIVSDEIGASPPVEESEGFSVAEQAWAARTLGVGRT